MKHTIVDNFLKAEEFQALKNSILSEEFPWFAYSGITHPNFNDTGKLQALNETKDWAFFHLFYQNHKPNSDYFDILNSLITKLKIKALLRSKANLYPRTTNIEEHKFHYDYKEPNKSAVFSLNTNDGFTILSDGTKVKSIENRILKL